MEDIITTTTSSDTNQELRENINNIRVDAEASGRSAVSSAEEVADKASDKIDEFINDAKIAGKNAMKSAEEVVDKASSIPKKAVYTTEKDTGVYTSVYEPRSEIRKIKEGVQEIAEGTVGAVRYAIHETAEKVGREIHHLGTKLHEAKINLYDKIHNLSKIIADKTVPYKYDFSVIEKLMNVPQGLKQHYNIVTKVINEYNKDEGANPRNVYNLRKELINNDQEFTKNLETIEQNLKTIKENLTLKTKEVLKSNIELNAINSEVDNFVDNLDRVNFDYKKLSSNDVLHRIENVGYLTFLDLVKALHDIDLDNYLKDSLYYTIKQTNLKEEAIVCYDKALYQDEKSYAKAILKCSYDFHNIGFPVGDNIVHHDEL